MRQLLTLFTVLLFTACRSTNTTVQPTLATGDPIYTDPTGWASVQLNTAYTIRFPAGYEGPGAVGFEGLSFGKNRVDKRATFSYAFCGPLLCNEYGDPLFGQAPASVTYNGQTLAKSITLTQAGQTTGIFYYSELDKATGLLYLAEKGQLKESLHVQFDNAVQAEVLTIVKTIQPTL